MNIKNRILLSHIALIFLFGILSCENKIGSKLDSVSQTKKDSIPIWVASGRDESNSNTVRKDNLIKAHTSAQSIKDDSTRLRNLSRIQWSFLHLKDSLWFRKTNKETNQLAKKEQDSIRLAGSFWDLGIFLERNEINDSAYYHFSSAKKLYEALQIDVNVGKLEYDMASIQSKVKNYTSAEINTIRAIELLKPFEENFMLYRCYNLLGNISKDLGEYDKSLEYYTIAEDYIERLDSQGNLESELTNNIGVNYLEKGEYKIAAGYFIKTLNQDSLRQKYPESFARSLNNFAQSQYRINSGTDVEEMFLRSLKIRDSIGNTSDLAGGFYILSEYYLFKRDTIKAIKSARKAKIFAQESNNNERLLESLALLTQLDPENAALHGQRYIALNDSLQQEERKIRNKFARIRFETDEVVAENQLLAREKQLWAGIAIAILLLGTAAYVIISQRAKNQKLRFQQEQQVSNEKIFNLMLSEKQKFEEGKKLEQKRISEELHDGVLGKMLGARMVLTGLNKKGDQEAIDERANAIVALKDVEGEVRSISHELSHAAYQEIHNFIRSIRDLLQNIGDSAGINHTFIHDDTVDWDDLKGDIKINIYRMVQESLQNAVKHAKCKNIVLNFSVVDDNLKVLLKDDGIGFKLGKKKKGIGMRNIGSRIKKLDGSWNIESAPGSGTAVRLTVPIDYNSKEPSILNELKKVEKV